MKTFAVVATAFLGAEGVRLMAASSLKREEVKDLAKLLKDNREGVCAWKAGEHGLPEKWPTGAEVQDAEAAPGSDSKHLRHHKLADCKTKVGSACAQYESVIDAAKEDDVKARIRELCPKPTTTTTTTTTTAAPGGGGSC